MNYETLSIVEVQRCLADIARDAASTFGGLTPQQLNWRPDEARWSVAQCFDHLLSANRQVFKAADEALTGVAAPTVWQKLPVLPGVFGKALIRSQSPSGTKKYQAPPQARPSASDIAADVIEHFVGQTREAMARVGALDDRAAARAIMTSPFIRFVTYSVLDGWRIVVAHDRRHFEQARRVTEEAGFPRA